jgi:hypothetical protein
MIEITIQMSSDIAKGIALTASSLVLSPVGTYVGTKFLVTDTPENQTVFTQLAGYTLVFAPVVMGVSGLVYTVRGFADLLSF